ncbi:hypothetical protein [Patulibacter sp. SYSU D01012]|uniref:hypothetical protein n=1 Tax=Patulibacter sp. SYSU D01012 TaxID=2817381 RepID=UPI001B30A24F|nr:hypothetical protein [Patulibacter sp. SYSU D01012]
MLPLLRRAALAAPLILAAAPAVASADAIAITVAPAVVPAGGTLHVRVTPSWTDGQVFRQASIRVLRPGRACAGPDVVVPDEDVLAGGGTGPMRVADGPVDVAIDLPEDAPPGKAAVCTEVADVASGLVGNPAAGPSAEISITAAAAGGGTGDGDGGDDDGTVPGSGSAPVGGGAGSATRACVVLDRRLPRRRARLRVRCSSAVRGRLAVRLRCVPRRGRPVTVRRTTTLRHGRAAVRLPRLPRGRCQVVLRHGSRVVGARAVTVR